MMIQSTIKKMAVRMITAQIHQSILRPPKKNLFPLLCKGNCANNRHRKRALAAATAYALEAEDVSMAHPP